MSQGPNTITLAHLSEGRIKGRLSGCQSIIHTAVKFQLCTGTIYLQRNPCAPDLCTSMDMTNSPPYRGFPPDCRLSLSPIVYLELKLALELETAYKLVMLSVSLSARHRPAAMPPQPNNLSPARQFCFYCRLLIFLLGRI